MTNQTNLSPEASINTIHSTISQAQTSMYLAGTTSIFLIWGALSAIGFLADFAIANLASDFSDDNPWFRAPLWATIIVIGMIASSVIGSRASKQLTDPSTARRIGLKVFAFWLTIGIAALTIPGLSGLWTAPDPGQHIAGVAIGIVALGHILFGLFTRIVISILGIGIAIAYYVPAHFAGDAAYPITAVLVLILVAVSAIWLKKNGIQ